MPRRLSDEERAEREMSESALQGAILEVAKVAGWKAHHVADSYRGRVLRGHTGFPDLVLARRGRLIFAECKRQDGALEPAQEEWQAVLMFVERATNSVVSYRVWRPRDLMSRTVDEVLR
jgi:hypothetical protein